MLDWRDGPRGGESTLKTIAEDVPPFFWHLFTHPVMKYKLVCGWCGFTTTNEDSVQGHVEDHQRQLSYWRKDDQYDGFGDGSNA